MLPNHMRLNNLNKLTIYGIEAIDNAGIVYIISKSCKGKQISENTIVYYGTRGTEKVYILSNRYTEGMTPGYKLEN